MQLSQPNRIGAAEARIIAIMRELGISSYTVKTWLVDGRLADELRVHFHGDNVPGQGSTANEFEQPAFGLLKELELLAMGQES